MNNYKTIIDKISKKVDKYLSDLLEERAKNLTEEEVVNYRENPHEFIYDNSPFMLDSNVDINRPSTIILFEEVSLEDIETYINLELTKEERELLQEEGFNASSIRIEDYFETYTSDSFLILNEKSFYTMNYKNGTIYAEIRYEEYEPWLGLWYKLSDNDGLISYIVGFRIEDSSKKTVKKEILRLIDSGYIDTSIKIINEEIEIYERSLENI